MPLERCADESDACGPPRDRQALPEGVSFPCTKARMKRTKLLLEPLQKRALYLTTAILWVSGGAWLYLLETDPARPLWMKLHGAAAMFFLIIFGTLLMQPVPLGWQQDNQRPSGASLIAVCRVLIATGLALHYVGGQTD